MSDTRSSDLFVAFGIGLLAGAVTGLLLAPATGEQTRRRIGELAEGGMDRLREGAEAAREMAARQTEAVKSFAADQRERIQHAVEEGKRAYQRETTRTS